MDLKKGHILEMGKLLIKCLQFHIYLSLISFLCTSCSSLLQYISSKYGGMDRFLNVSALYSRPLSKFAVKHMDTPMPCFRNAKTL